MEYLRDLIGESWSDTWEVVFNSRFITVAVAVLIFALSTFIHWYRKGFSDVKDALVVAAEGAVATVVIFAFVFALQFLFFTPKRITQSLQSQVRIKPVQDEPRIKI